MLNFPPCLSLRLFVCLAHSIYISALGRGVLLFSLSSSSFYMLLFGVPKYNDGPMQHKRRLQRVLYIPRNHASVHCCVLFFLILHKIFLSFSPSYVGCVRVCDLAPPDGAYPLNIFSVTGPGETTSFKAHQRGRAIPGDGNPRAQELRHSAASRFDSEYILV